MYMYTSCLQEAPQLPEDGGVPLGRHPHDHHVVDVGGKEPEAQPKVKGRLQAAARFYTIRGSSELYYVFLGVPAV